MFQYIANIVILCCAILNIAAFLKYSNNIVCATYRVVLQYSQVAIHSYVNHNVAILQYHQT